MTLAKLHEFVRGPDDKCSMCGMGRGHRSHVPPVRTGRYFTAQFDRDIEIDPYGCGMATIRDIVVAMVRCSGSIGEGVEYENLIRLIDYHNSLNPDAKIDMPS